MNSSPGAIGAARRADARMRSPGSLPSADWTHWTIADYSPAVQAGVNAYFAAGRRIGGKYSTAPPSEADKARVAPLVEAVLLAGFAAALGQVEPS